MPQKDPCYAAMALSPDQTQPVFYFQSAALPEIALASANRAIQGRYGNKAQVVALFTRADVEHLLAQIDSAEASAPTSTT